MVVMIAYSYSYKQRASEREHWAQHAKRGQSQTVGSEMQKGVLTEHVCPTNHPLHNAACLCFGWNFCSSSNHSVFGTPHLLVNWIHSFTLSSSSLKTFYRFCVGTAPHFCLMSASFLQASLSRVAHLLSSFTVWLTIMECSKLGFAIPSLALIICSLSSKE